MLGEVAWVERERWDGYSFGRAEICPVKRDIFRWSRYTKQDQCAFLMLTAALNIVLGERERENDWKFKQRRLY